MTLSEKKKFFLLQKTPLTLRAQEMEAKFSSEKFLIPVWIGHHTQRHTKDEHEKRSWNPLTPATKAPFTQDVRRHVPRDASKWDLLFSMGVFTLHASNIKGFAVEFACASRPASCVNETQSTLTPQKE